jgi:flagellar motor switch protein FliN/FliY
MTSEESKSTDTAESPVAIQESEITDLGSEQTGDETHSEQPAGGDTRDAVKKAEFQRVTESHPKSKPAGMDLLLEVTLPVSIELGRTTKCVKEILSICEGSVIELDRLAGEPVDIMVGGRLLGRGEVVVMNDRFGVRITELVNLIEGVAKP